MTQEIVLATTGQLLLHGPIDTGEAAGPLRNLLAGAAAVSNLEATVETPGAWLTKTKTHHLAAAPALASLRALGFDALTHANNHAFDLGPPGIERTRAAAAAVGLAFTGSGADFVQALAPAWIATAGGPVAVLAADLGPQPDIVYAAPDRAGIVRLAISRSIALPGRLADAVKEIDAAVGDGRRAAARAAVGYQAEAANGDGFTAFGTRFVPGEAVTEHHTADPADLARLVGAMAGARRAGAALVVVVLHSHHWDPEWTRTPGWTLDLARSLIDAGADAILGHGAPVLQGMAMHRGRPILAGLGNAVFHTRRADVYRREGTDVFRSVAVRLRFAPGGTCRGVEAMPLAVGEEQAGGISPAPVLLTGDDANAMMQRLTAGLGPAEQSLVTRTA